MNKEQKMTDLTQQLEDKKKGCGVDIGGVPCGEFIAHTEDEDGREWGKTYYCKHCKEIIAILEQAIAEIEKQRQEILEKIENTNWADVFDGTSYDVVENEVCGHDTFWPKEDLNRDLKLRIKQQLNQPKTEQ